MSTRPTAYDIHSYFGRFLKYRTTKPCGDPQAENQCAVRLSIALEGLGPGFLDDFEPPNRVHRDRSTCPNLPPHVLGAAELGRYLVDQWGAPFTYSSQTERQRAREALNGRSGVVWFGECYPAGRIRSDHIDFWNGWHCMNELLGISAGGGLGAGADLFAKSAGRICFFPLT